MDTLDFSLIVACYNNDGEILRKNIAKIKDVFRNTTIKYEILFIDDKSANNILSIINDILAEHPQWRLLKHDKNMGRGRTVSDGVKISKAPIVGYIDIDLSTSPWYLPRLIQEVAKGADIATAVRVYKLKPRTLFRWILSKGYNFVMRIFLKSDLQDTETGCKVFNKKRILPVLEEIKDPHWFWDTEVMVLSDMAGYKIVEVPTIFIREGLFTTVRILKDTMTYLINLVKFRKQLLRIRKRIKTR